ncbi:MAG: alpha/beta hydrolase, partial [Flavobacteriaceae bacterium]|nr:alpha/beta hydrolase [Flavobacteriaceae bacterium]
FSENNYSIELDDLARVIDFLSGPNPFSEELQPQHISLIGHSRGGGIVLIKAAEDRRITNVVTWAGVSDYKSRFNRGTKAFAAWKQKGVKYIENGRTKQQMPHLFQFYQDFEDNEKRLTIERAVRSVRIPQLIVHGAEDPTVPVAEAHALHGWNSQSSLKIIENADHVFNTKHPWEKPVLSPQLQEAVDISISFLKKAQ